MAADESTEATRIVKAFILMAREAMKEIPDGDESDSRRCGGIHGSS